MYICICRGITEKQLQDASRGRAKVQDVLQRLNVGKDCGTCLSIAIESYVKYQGGSPTTSRAEGSGKWPDH